MSEIIPFNKKLVDIGVLPKNGRIDHYWFDKIINNIFYSNRKSKERKNTSFKFYDPQYLLKTFNLGGFEFGNWLSQEDRYVYMAGCAYAMKDYCDLHNIPYKKFGFNNLSIAFGARGKGGGSLAHFEPSSNIINLTRHRKNDENKSKKYLLKNGAGSLGHEYAHAMDFKVGRNAKNLPYNFASESIEIIKYNHKNKDGVLIYRFKNDFKIDASVRPFYKVMKSLLFESVGKNEFIRSSFYENLLSEVEKSLILGKYWLQKEEIFARSFEIYLLARSEEKGLKETFLKENKYDEDLYPSIDFIKKSGAYENFEYLISKFYNLKSVNPQKKLF